jgi:uncharacterized protein YraI
MIRTLLFAAVLTVTSAGASFATTYWTTRDLNMRSGPGTNYHAQYVIPGCTQVEARRSQHGWLNVYYRHNWGWSSARYLSQHRPQHCRPRHAPQPHYGHQPQHPRPHGGHY